MAIFAGRVAVISGDRYKLELMSFGQIRQQKKTLRRRELKEGRKEGVQEGKMERRKERKGKEASKASGK